MRRKEETIGFGSPKRLEAQTPTAEQTYMTTPSGYRFIEAKTDEILAVIDSLHSVDGEKIDSVALREPLKVAMIETLSRLGEAGKNLNAFMQSQNIDSKYHEKINEACAKCYRELHDSEEFRFYNNLFETVTTEQKFCSDMLNLAGAYEKTKMGFIRVVNDALKANPSTENRAALWDKFQKIFPDATKVHPPASPEENEKKERELQGKRNRQSALKQKSYKLSIEEMEETIADCVMIGDNNAQFRQVLYHHLENFDYENRAAFFKELNESFLNNDFRDYAEASVRYNIFLTLYYSNDYSLDFNKISKEKDPAIRKAIGVIAQQHLAPTQRLPRLNLKLQDMVKEERKHQSDQNVSNEGLEQVESAQRKIDRMVTQLNESGLSCDQAEVVKIPLAMGASMIQPIMKRGEKEKEDTLQKKNVKRFRMQSTKPSHASSLDLPKEGGFFSSPTEKKSPRSPHLSTTPNSAPPSKEPPALPKDIAVLKHGAVWALPKISENDRKKKVLQRHGDKIEQKKSLGNK